MATPKQINITPPSSVEVDAVERVLAEAHNQPCDGYWRDLSTAALEAAKEAHLETVLAEIDARIDATEAALAHYRAQLDIAEADVPVEDALEAATGGTRR